LAAANSRAGGGGGGAGSFLGRLGGSARGGGGGGLDGGSAWGRVLDGVRTRRASGSGGNTAFRASGAAAVAASDARTAATAVATRDVEHGSPSGGGGGGGGAKAAKAAPAGNGAAGGGVDAPSPSPGESGWEPPALTWSPSTRSAGGADDADTAAADRVSALQTELDAWWWRHVAWMVDMGAFGLLCSVYIIALVGIFATPYLAARRAKAAGRPDGSIWQAEHDDTAPGGLLIPAAA